MDFILNARVSLIAEPRAPSAGGRGKCSQRRTASPAKGRVDCGEEEAAQPGQDLIREGNQNGGPSNPRHQGQEAPRASVPVSMRREGGRLPPAAGKGRAGRGQCLLERSMRRQCAHVYTCLHARLPLADDRSCSLSPLTSLNLPTAQEAPPKRPGPHKGSSWLPVPHFICRTALSSWRDTGLGSLGLT